MVNTTHRDTDRQDAAPTAPWQPAPQVPAQRGTAWGRRWSAKVVRGGLALALGLVVVGYTPHAAAAPKHGDKIPGAYIITFTESVTDVDALVATLATGHGLQVRHTYTAALKGFAAVVPNGKLAALQALPEVAAIEQDTVVQLPDDELHATTGDSSSIQAATLPTGIDRIDGEVSSTISGDGSGSVHVDVAVIDTGIQLDHPDLQVVGGINCNTGASFADGDGHGTHVAGTIAARDDGTGVVGVAPGARLWAVRVLNDAGSGSTAQVICGIDWVTANAGTIEVANMSLGGTGSDSKCGKDSYHRAICRSVAAGVTYAVAAGNAAADASGFLPATYEEVITVSALADFNGQPDGGAAATCRADGDDTLADFSNYGADVDLIAPGVCILSTWTGSGYTTISGTSMASPHVAGAAALYTATHPDASPAQVKRALQNAADTTWDGSGDPDGIQERLLNVATF